MKQTCATCRRWQPPTPKNIKLGLKRGKCPLTPKDKYPEEQCFSWGWMEASGDQIESRVKAGIVKAEEVGA